MSLDRELLLWINQSWADPGLDFLFHWVSGRAGFSLPLLLILLYLFWRRFSIDGIKLWLLLVLGVGLGDLLGNLLKAYFAQPRPCFELFELLRPPGGGTFSQCDAPASGMPSSHALNFFSVAMFVTLTLGRVGSGLLMVGIAVLVGLSRIYLGKHYPSQVAAGAFFGILFGLIWGWASLHAFEFGRRILAQPRESLDFDPMAWLKLGRRSVGLGYSMPLVWLPLLISFLLAVLVWVADLNKPLFLLLNQLGVVQSDRLWGGLTLLGDTLVGFALLSLFFRHRLDIIGALLLAALFATLWAQGLKPLFDLPRPLAALGEESVHVIGHALKQHTFPSGHTTAAFTLAGVILLRGVHPILALMVLALALLAGISRAVVGAHWPLDILAGIFGGWLSAVLGIRLAELWGWQPGRWWRLLLYLFLLVCALSLLFTRQLGYPEAIGVQVLIALAALGYLLSLLPMILRQLRA